jgi:UDP-glucose 4-epimerase
MRVLITGMGSELGTRVALLLEETAGVGEIAGIDVDPPRRRLRRAVFHRIDLRDRRRVRAVVRDYEPQAVVHLGIEEPDARSAPRVAAERTSAGTLVVLGQAAESGSLEQVVVRSGIEVYGRRRGCVTVPDETVPPNPTSGFGRVLLEAERVAAAAGRAAGAPVAALRFAPVVGPHFPSPLGRVLRLPLVPFAALADPPFSLVHQEDAAMAVVAALLAGVDGPVNVVGAGAATAAQAARLGGRVPLPVSGPAWPLLRRASELLGAPLPDHVVELLRRGRTADGSACADRLGVAPEQTTLDVVKAVFEWAPVTPLRLAA